MTDNILHALRAAGVTPPDDLTAAAHRYADARDALRTLGEAPVSAAELARQLLDPEQADARTILTAAAMPTVLNAGGPQSAMVHLRQGVGPVLHRQYADLVAEHRQSVIVQLQPAFRADGMTLAGLVARFPEGDPQDILNAGDDAVAAMRAHIPVLARMDRTAAAVAALNGGVDVSTQADMYSGRTRRYGGYAKDTPHLLGLLNPTPEHWPTFRDAAGRIGWEGYARLALALDADETLWTLADAAEADARYQAILDAEAEQQRRDATEAARQGVDDWKQTPEGKASVDLLKHHTASVDRLKQHAARG